MMQRRAASWPLVLVLVHGLLWAGPAFAQERQVVDMPPPKARSGASQALEITGYSLGGLGLLTFMAAGIVWLNAASEAGRLDDECPNKVCVEGTPGADSLESARDSERAADIVLGISLPMMAAGFVMVLYAGGSAKRRTVVRAAPSVSSRSAGGTLGVSF